jgi:5'(3')-deoxyribonucleotidase
MNLEIWMDADGVVADYEGDYKRRTGGDPSEKGKGKAMRFKNFPHFYAELPLMPDARKLWNFCKHLDPDLHILTACSNYLPTSREDKQHWFRKNFNFGGDHLIITAYPHDKYKHAAKNRILVDDSAKNCDEWVRAGGIAIHHKSVDDTIRRLKALFGHSEASHVVETFQAMQDTPNVIETFQALETPTATNVAEAFDCLWKMIEAGHDINSVADGYQIANGHHRILADT